MSAFPANLVAAALDNPSAALAGTDLRITLPLTRALLNELLAARPANTPVRELLIDPNARNCFRVFVKAQAPVLGTVSRQILFAPGLPVSFPDQPWLRFDIKDGLGFLDRSLISLLQGMIESKLPKGVELTSNYLRLHVPALMTDLGYQQLVPLVQLLSVKSEANRLILDLHLKAE
ncbi:hypothetical protein [Lewinella sp. IMCC34183]|uniref:hypothetical protein n=1 Tax=Lewinella sp. IMCC34183 TaxID=2248762 RepID=UPI000E25A0C5|nr:hypothetical protein [Lewinella sp. IMCC34183]